LIQAYLGARYQRIVREATLFVQGDLSIMIPVQLERIEFFAESKGSVNKIVSVEVSLKFSDEPEALWVSPDALYDVESLPLIHDERFIVWAKKQWLQQNDPTFADRFALVHDLIVNNEIEDEDAFDAVMCLGFNIWEADIILNYCP
jgi:hypothetical protein